MCRGAWRRGSAVARRGLAAQVLAREYAAAAAQALERVSASLITPFLGRMQ